MVTDIWIWVERPDVPEFMPRLRDICAVHVPIFVLKYRRMLPIVFNAHHAAREKLTEDAIKGAAFSVSVGLV